MSCRIVDTVTHLVRPSPIVKTAPSDTVIALIGEDLQRGSALSSPTVRTPGSDTFQNFMTGRRLGGGLVGHVPLLGKYLRGINDFVDRGVNQQLSDAMLDPQYAAALIRRGIPLRPLSARMGSLFRNAAFPSAAAPLAALPPPMSLPRPGNLALPRAVIPR